MIFPSMAWAGCLQPRGSFTQKWKQPGCAGVLSRKGSARSVEAEEVGVQPSVPVWRAVLELEKHSKHSACDVQSCEIALGEGSTAWPVCDTGEEGVSTAVFSKGSTLP